MRKVSTLAGLATAALLSACSPVTSADAEEKTLRTEAVAAAAAAPTEEKLAPVIDSQGNELDPVLADAFRAKMEEDKAAAEEAQQAAGAVDNGAPAGNDAT